MREKTRNLLIGTTVLIALALLGGMILIFQELPAFMQVGYEVRATMGEAGGVTPGADVVLAGKRIGRVTDVQFTDGDARKGVTFTIIIKSDFDVPGDVNPYLQSRGFAGGSTIELRSDGREPGASRGRQLQWLPRDRVLTLLPPPDAPSGGSGLLPADLVADVRATLAGVRSLTENLNAFLAPPAPAPSAPTGTAPAEAAQPANLHRTVARLDAALDDFHAVLGDAENQENIKAALAGFKAAAAAMAEAMGEVRAMADDARQAVGKLSGTAGKTAEGFDRLAAKLVDDADRIGKLLTTLTAAAEKLNAADGSAGKFLNDPRLYNDLADAAAGIKNASINFQALLEKWKAEGIEIKIK
jgi:phospholipid/cholesterol/gamma-HCH transport system substrate-binding protein